MSDKTHMNDSRESYSVIVPAKQQNKSGRPPAEAVEGRTLTKENVGRPNPYWTPSQKSGPSGLDRVREAARKNGKLRFTALLHHVTIDLLRDSYYSLKKKAAPGVDGVTWPRIWRGPGGAIERLAWANPSWGLSSATVEANLDPERRWATTTIGNRGVGR
jgi:RNA-directed DNA polymerase